MAILLLGAGSAAHATPPDVVINEIMYAPQPHQNEYIELYNRSDDPVDVSTLEYANGHREFVPIADETHWLDPGDFLVIVRAPDLFEERFPDVPYLDPGGFRALRNGGDEVIIRHATGIVDEVEYVPAWGGTSDVSLERIDPYAPSQAAFNWASSEAPTGGSPGQPNSVFAPNIDPPVPTFAEVNAERTGVALTFNEAIDPASLSEALFLAGNEEGSIHELPDAQTLRLEFDAAISTSDLIVDGVRDFSGNQTEQAVVPLAYVPDEGALAINEIMYRPMQDDFDGQPNQPEYVELLNVTDRHVSLQGLFTTNRPRQQGGADTLDLGIGRTALPPDAYAVVYAEPHDVEDGALNTLERAFPTQHNQIDAATVIAVPRSRLGLRVQEDRVRVHRADGQSVATVSYSPDWHAPGLSDDRGVALERISRTAPGQQATNWTSSTHPEGGTPGGPNSVGPPPATASENPLQISPSSFDPDQDQAARIQYALSFDPDWVQLRIFDAHGRQVRTVEETVLTGPTGEVLWDGRSDGGTAVRIGMYIVLFEAQQWSTGETAHHRATLVVGRPM